MPKQHLAPEDLKREIRAVFAMRAAGDLDANFCMGHRGNLFCARHKKHHGKHAAGTGHVTAITRVVRW